VAALILVISADNLASNFFTATALLGVPVLLLVWLASKQKPPPSG